MDFMSSWLAVKNWDGDAHVLPIDDLMTHTETRECACGPFVDLSSDVPVIIHHAADFREYSERSHVHGRYEQVPI